MIGPLITPVIEITYHCVVIPSSIRNNCAYCLLIIFMIPTVSKYVQLLNKKILFYYKTSSVLNIV